MANKFATLSALLLSLVAADAFALKSDKSQLMNLDANYQKSVQSKTGAANDPDITDYDGNIVITQGSIKITSDHAKVYRIPSGSNDPNEGKMSRVILTGKQAHMQQVHDGDCALMTSNAYTIDYNPITDIAELTGNVTVVQAGHGTFTGEHMLYNTDTGDMESGDVSSATQRIHTVMEPKTDKPAPSPNNCGFPGAPPNPAAPAKSAAPPKPAAPAKPAANAGSTP